MDSQRGHVGACTERHQLILNSLDCIFLILIISDNGSLRIGGDFQRGMDMLVPMEFWKNIFRSKYDLEVNRRTTRN